MIPARGYVSALLFHVSALGFLIDVNYLIVMTIPSMVSVLITAMMAIIYVGLRLQLLLRTKFFKMDT